jgi:hypothetical protein
VAGRQLRLELAAQRRVLGAEALHEGGAFRGRQLPRLLELAA